MGDEEEDYSITLKLYLCPVKKKGVYEIPDKVDYIYGYAFYDCSDLTRQVVMEIHKPHQV